MLKCENINKAVKAKHSNLRSKIGFIWVDAYVGLNLQSLLSVSKIALRRAKESDISDVINYADLKKLKH